MNFAPIHGIIGSVGWPGGYVVTQLDFQTIDDHISKTINADGGSTHAPSASIIVGGQGFEFAGANHHVSGTLKIDNGGLLSLVSGSVVTAASGSVIRGVLTFGDGTADAVATWAHGSLTFATGTTLHLQSGSSLTIDSGTTVSVASSAGFSGTVNFTGTVTMNGVSGLIVNTQLTMGASSHLAFASGADVTGTAILNGVLALGTGHINYRAPFEMTDADATKGVNDCDLVMVESSVFTADHILTVTSTGAGLGSRMRVWVNESTHTLTLKQDSGFAFATLKSGAGGAAASGFYKWVDLQHNGSPNGWFIIGGLYV